MSPPIRGQGGHLGFPISLKNTNLVEDVEILLPVKFHWVELNWLFNVTINDISVIYVTAHRCAGGLKKKLDLRSGSQRHRHFVGFFNVPVLAPTRDQPFYPFSSFRGEVKNASANLRPGRPYCFSDRLKKHKLGRAHWDLASCQVSSNSLQRFKRRSQKCLSQSELGAAILFFRSARKTQTW